MPSFAAPWWGMTADHLPSSSSSSNAISGVVDDDWARGSRNDAVPMDKSLLGYVGGAPQTMSIWRFRVEVGGFYREGV